MIFCSLPSEEVKLKLGRSGSIKKFTRPMPALYDHLHAMKYCATGREGIGSPRSSAQLKITYYLRLATSLIKRVIRFAIFARVRD